MKATIKSVTEIDSNGWQTITFDVYDDNNNQLLVHTIHGDVEQLKDDVRNFLRDYRAKIKSKNRFNVGDTIEVN